ncbi:MAG: hypothetical protein ACE37F_01405 [Nannocystaceae bacterium]|nr:hypothetical protein [bacterium]
MRLVHLAPLVVLLGCSRPSLRPATSTQLEASAAQRAWHYTATLASDRSSIDVQLCFEGPAGERLVTSNNRAADYIEKVRHGTRRIPKTGRTFSLEGVEGGDCIDYAIDLAGMSKAEGSSRHVRAEGESILLRQSMWLWRPRGVPEDIEVTMTLNLPEGMEASVPWVAMPGEDRSARTCRYRLDSTVFGWIGYNAFGELGVQRFEAGGTDVEVATLDQPMRATRAGLRAWGTDAVDATAQLFGTYPRDHVQMLVLPVDGSGAGSVYFGMAGRGGGSGIYILMSDRAEDDELLGGWTTTHELLHHGMPFIDDAWMAEGWVSYYTELQRTRQGHRDEAEGWQELYEAFGRGRRTRRSGTLEHVSDTMHQNFGYQRVYWGGAATAFALDVALREDSGGEKSLDDAMRFLRSCCGDAKHKWDADTLLGKLDAWYGTPIFTQTVQPMLSQEGFPDVETTFEALGIDTFGGRVRLDDGHPMAAQRRAIMAPRPD